MHDNDDEHWVHNDISTGTRQGKSRIERNKMLQDSFTFNHIAKTDVLK